MRLQTLTLLALLPLVPASSTPQAQDPGDAQPTSLEKEILAPGAEVKKLAGELGFTEGPVWIPADGGYLVFSDIPNDELKKWQDGELTTFRKPSRQTNGNLLDEEGRLVSCEHFSRSVTRTGPEGKVEKLVVGYQGKRLNSPNDLAIRSDGTIWFSDPPYGLRGRTSEQQANHVFCLTPKTGKLLIVAADFDRPNGLCLSPDEKLLYIADSGAPKHIRVFTVKPDGTLEQGRVFCELAAGSPDGIRCDEQGRVFAAAGDGVHIFGTDGTLLGKIPVPETPANLCFGGPDNTTLFITARTSLYSVELRVKGAPPASRKRSKTDSRRE